MPNLEDVAIFWDYENCPAPANTSGFEVVNGIRRVARSIGSVKLFKAYLEISEPVAKSLALRSELQSSGVSLTDCPHNGRKDVADKMILVDMLAYAIDNPPPSTIVLISGDRDFAYAISTLRLRRYRVVLITLSNAHFSLISQASLCLDWNADVLRMQPSSPPHATVPLSESPSKHQRYRSNSSLDERTKPRLPNFLRMRSKVDYEDEGMEDDFFEVDPTRRFQDEAQTRFRVHSPVKSTARVNSSVDNYDSSYSLPANDPSESRSKNWHEIANNPSKANSENFSAKLNLEELPATNPLESGLIPPALPDAAVTSPLASVELASSYGWLTPRSSSISAATTAYVLPDQPLLPHSSAPSTSSSVTIVHGSDLNQSVEVMNPNGAKIVPPIFRTLVERLEFHRLKGFERVFRSGLAVEIATNDPTAYRRAGVEKFGQYVALAEKAGIVQLGGKEGTAWISLTLEWYDARIL